MDNITAISNAEGYRIILQNHFKECEKYSNKLLGITILPIIVISLLEIEMLFKAKLFAEGKPYPKGHNISKLFKLLQPRSQNNISDKYNKTIQKIQRNKGCELLTSEDLIKLLDDDLFTKFRYLDDPSVKSISISLLDSISYFRYTLEKIFKLPSVEMIANYDYNPKEEKLESDIEFGKDLLKNI